MDLSETIITKLFDTLSKSIDDTKIILDKSVDTQISSINYLKPKIDILEKDSTITLNYLRKISSKLTITISVISIICALMGIIYYISRFFFPNNPPA